jgi:hypothetical protein
MKRSELYEKVWATPMTQLAAEFGISDVGLAKACRRHAIPAPPRVVREQLAAKNPVDEMLTRCLSAPSWGTWPPDWWPGESAGED